MHSKIINPDRDGKNVFDNKGSVAKTIAYLGHEAKEQGRESTFFNQNKEGVPAEEVQAAIDNNTKGLRKTQEKFYSLVLSPSDKELRHIGRNPSKLRAYTQAVMENYAANFHLRDGRARTSDDFVWFATIHQERKKGTVKTGWHTHIHVVVSANDQHQQVRLNPRGRKNHFLIRDWQAKNGATFQQLFDYQQATISEKFTRGTISSEHVKRHRIRIEEKVAYLNGCFLGSHKLDSEQVLAIGEKQGYGKGFFYNLHHLTEQYQQGKIISDPYQQLDPKERDSVAGKREKSLSSFHKQLQSFSYGIGEDIEGGSEEYEKRKPGKIRRPSGLER
ncbi:DUF5712 family protein [Tunicatimonas pelagia]|uniref:DUF5712 family protein n=1 Tax=Tunicatimonas pelagia TaxID=931531 RepID=UPI0026658768|nr:DUF5712 family protein [Tunicatimonas pelagia]WKN44887.1 DUF5712 family protein [Tunicatimonas pelagia]